MLRDATVCCWTLFLRDWLNVDVVEELHGNKFLLFIVLPTILTLMFISSRLAFNFGIVRLYIFQTLPCPAQVLLLFDAQHTHTTSLAVSNKCCF